MKPTVSIARELLTCPCPHPRGFAARINRHGCPDCLTDAIEQARKDGAAAERDACVVAADSSAADFTEGSRERVGVMRARDAIRARAS